MEHAEMQVYVYTHMNSISFGRTIVYFCESKVALALSATETKGSEQSGRWGQKFSLCVLIIYLLNWKRKTPQSKRGIKIQWQRMQLHKCTRHDAFAFR